MTTISAPAWLAAVALIAVAAVAIAVALRPSAGRPHRAPMHSTTVRPPRQMFASHRRSPRYYTKSGYVLVYAPRHPLRRADGFVLEHRKVLYDAIGDGPHHCAWCDTTIHWKPKKRAEPLVVDHVDGDKQNNELANLRPSCRTCNTKRTAPLVDAVEFSRRFPRATEDGKTHNPFINGVAAAAAVVAGAVAAFTVVHLLS